MRNRISTVVCIAFLCIAFALTGCTRSTVWQEALTAAAAANKYAILSITDGTNAASRAMQESLRESVKKSSAPFTIVEVDATTDKSALLKFLNVKELRKVPMAMVIAPNGAKTGLFTEAITPEALQSAVVCAQEANIVLSLQKGEIAFVCLHKGKSSELEKAKAQLQPIGANYAGSIAVYYVDTEDQRSASLVGKLPPLTSNPTVHAISPSGAISASLGGPQITLANLMKAAQSCSSGCGPKGCGTQKPPQK